MIWYLLYPFRGTTEVPVLTPTHPLRRAFTRYGRYAARHVLATLIISVALTLILVYPCPFLYSHDFTTGASNIPHHVWTDAQPLDETSITSPDVIMRSIWVHGSYMKALDHDVLLGALELQDEILGPTRNFDPRQPAGSNSLPDPTGDLSPTERDKFHVVNGLTNESWFFHSPLQYWSCDAENVMNDPDIVRTVNERKSQSTSVNVTLRHSIVFSGKRFEDRRLVAADALVITLIHLRNSPVGRQWERRAEGLAARMADKWQVIPPDGRITSSQLYEFQFRPVSAQDSLLLVVAYCLMALYFILSLSKIRALKSRAGLIVTMLTQIIASMASSLTLCALFKIDLSKIPYAAYPLVVFAISMENSFRLINAVIMTSPNHSTSSRIGEAFGETAHVAAASRIQNLLILWLLSKMTFPGVSAFCTFAAIAILIDFVYLSTFFLSVLSIDVQRTELSDALDKAVSTANHKSRTNIRGRQTWTDAIMRGNIALSTRIAGTIVMVGFVLMAQWHFLENAGIFTMLGRSMKLSWKYAETSPKSSLLTDIHQARSPTSWLRLQDHGTAREVINIVKPWAHSYVARVYDPLIFVMKGADRMLNHKERMFLPAVYDFIHHELHRFIVSVLVVMGLVWLFMNYLLWDELAEAKRGGGDEDPLLSIKTLSEGHLLDVAMLTACRDGHLVSAGLDRIIQVWDIRTGSCSPVMSDPDRPEDNPFPILAMAVSHDSNWLALLSPQKVLLWNLWEQKWGKSMPVDLGGHRVELLLFTDKRRSAIPTIVVVKRNGVMLEVSFDEDEVSEYLVCKTPLVCAVPMKEKSSGSPLAPQSSILTVSRRSCIHQVTKHDDVWISEELSFPTREEKDVQAVIPIPACSIYLIARLQTVDVVDFRSSKIIHTFQTEPMQPRTLKYLRSTSRQTHCGSTGLASLTLAYVSSETGECVLQTYLPKDDDEAICFCDPLSPKTSACCVLTTTRQLNRRVKDPGSWETLPNGSVVGVRTKSPEVAKDRSSSISPTLSGLRRRTTTPTKTRPKSQRDKWEVWVMSQLDSKQENYETRPLLAGEDEDDVALDNKEQHLIVSHLGPIVKVGGSSAAVGFGDTIKVVTVGHERFENPMDSFFGEDLINLTNRRRKIAGGQSRRGVSGGGGVGVGAG
ncbi:sterol-sensing domain of SREBP cleavage-activation-domain-containing protein [Coniochaeta sp. 2T2.1]|nr:sterol-sensing domain of SREBP cleavage-activation-domain-containing protein [Coniochaeta sp. 2T2.1]